MRDPGREQLTQRDRAKHWVRACHRQIAVAELPTAHPNQVVAPDRFELIEQLRQRLAGAFLELRETIERLESTAPRANDFGAGDA